PPTAEGFSRFPQPLQLVWSCHFGCPPHACVETVVTNDPDVFSKVSSHCDLSPFSPTRASWQRAPRPARPIHTTVSRRGCCRDRPSPTDHSVGSRSAVSPPIRESLLPTAHQPPPGVHRPQLLPERSPPRWRHAGRAHSQRGEPGCPCSPSA